MTKQPTILELEARFNRAIKKYGILDYRLYHSEIQGDKVIMGAHLTMSYLAGTRLSPNAVKILTALVRRFYRKPIDVHNHSRTRTTYGWLDYNDPHRTRHEIVFVFEDGLANDTLQEH